MDNRHRWAPLTGHLSLGTSHWAPLGAHLSLGTSHWAPLGAHLSVPTSHWAPLGAHLSVGTSHYLLFCYPSSCYSSLETYRSVPSLVVGMLQDVCSKKQALKESALGRRASLSSKGRSMDGDPLNSRPRSLRSLQRWPSFQLGLMMARRRFICSDILAG